MFDKLFCKHKWNTHAKETKVKYSFADYCDTYAAWGFFQGKPIEYTIEILICEKCGKIKVIEY